MDLSSLDLTPSADAGATMTVKHPVTDEPLLARDGSETTITLLGSESTKMRDQMKARAQKFLNKKQKAMSVDDSIQAAAETLAACTTGWHGLEDGGKDVEFSQKTAVVIYVKYDWLRQQVDAFVAERGNFFKA